MEADSPPPSCTNPRSRSPLHMRASRSSSLVVSSRDQVIGIDKNTGLPRLQIEFLPPDADGMDDLDKSNTSPHTKHHAGSKPSRTSPGSRHKDVQHTHSVDDKTNAYWRKRQSQLKTRSRSVFIKLQRTPPTPHRNIPIPWSDSSDTDIQTAPILPGKEHKFLFHDDVRRNSEDIRHHWSQSSLPESDDVCEDLPNSLPSANKFSAITRRSSFLYQSDTEADDHPAGTTGKPISRTPSMGSHVGDETYITPFAQILANLHRVRSQFIMLVGLPDDYCIGNHPNPHSHSHSHCPSPSHPTHQITDETRRQLAKDTLEELDWCLRKLESVDSAKSMGLMARDKFQRILSRELTQMSEKSRSSSHVAEWVHAITNWDRGEAVDRVLDRETVATPPLEPPASFDPTLTASLKHDDWTRLNVRINRSPQRSPSPTGSKHLTVPDYCERIPTFGISVPGMDRKKLKEFMDNSIEKWGVDTFHLSTISGGNPLVTAAYHIFKKRKLYTEFKIPPPIFVKFMSAVQKNYFPNPYHNPAHAADVLISTNYLLQAKALEGVFSNLEILAALVAAAVHDVAHPGKSNQFLINTGHELALLYNDISVLENHHLAVAFKLLQDPNCNFTLYLETEQQQAFRKMVIDMVLATDMSRHFRHLGELKTLLETKEVANDGLLVLDKYNDRSEVLQCLIHCADLTNPSKPEELAREWSLRIMEESFLQGDEEKKLGIPLNPLGDRDQVCIEKCQMTFIDLIAYPLWETWGELVYPDAQEILSNISRTREYWRSRIPNSPQPSEGGDPEMVSGSENGDEEDPMPVTSDGSSAPSPKKKKDNTQGAEPCERTQRDVVSSPRDKDTSPAPVKVVETMVCSRSSSTESGASTRDTSRDTSPACVRRSSFAASKDLGRQETEDLADPS